MADEEDDFPRWSKRKRFPFLPMDVEQYFEEMDKYLEDMFKDIQTRVPQDLIKERDLPDGSKIREMGPFIYGYSVTVGPDGKPVIREFGNIKPSPRGREPLELSDKREPLVDLFDEKNSVRIIAEIPGIEKEDINLDLEGRTLLVSVDAARKYYKKIELPADVDEKEIKANYKNGILEVTLKKTKPEEPRGRKINIE